MTDSSDLPNAVLPQEIIRKKRDGSQLTQSEIAGFVSGLTDGRITEGQAAALAMAVYFQGLAADECVALTKAMTESGRRLTWSGLDRPCLDKHSTGGVGDKVSLMLAPILAACGAAVPMISGRGLGHTGGTLDKLDAIPGYQSQPDIETFQRVINEVGCAIIGQTADLAPADRRLYAIRDVTATVESIALITASILSKKLAAGLDGLVMDVKVGSGAFMSSLEDARSLARSIISVANGADLTTRALITDMNQVLGWSAGNALEVRETVDYLCHNKRHVRLHDVVVALCSELLTLKGLADTQESATGAIDRALASGAAAERFQAMIAALGGPADLVDRPDAYLQSAPVTHAVHPDRGGYISAIDVRALGVAIVRLGGGRFRADQEIDYSVGLDGVAGLGDRVDHDRPIAVVHARDQAAAQACAEQIRKAVSLSDEAVNSKPTVYESLAGQ